MDFLEKPNSSIFSSEVKPFVKTSVTFIVLTIAWYSVILFSGSNIKIGKTPLVNNYAEYFSIKGGDTYIRFNQFSPDLPYDVLVFGSSHAYRSYDPRIFKKYGLQMYNLGSSGQSIKDTYTIVIDALSRSKPDFIIIDVTPGSFESDGIESSSKLITNVNESLAKKILANNLDWRLINVYVSRKCNLNEPVPFNSSEENGSYIDGGYVEIKKECKKKYDYSKIGSAFNPRIENIRAFEKLLSFLKKNNINAKLVLHPVPNETNHLQSFLFIKLINHFIANNNNIELIDYSFQHNLNKNVHFYDHHHLNHEGTSIFNNLLLQQLIDSNKVVSNTNLSK